MKQKICLLIAALSFCDLTTAMAAPHWGTFKKDSCKSNGTRQYSSILWGIEGSWESSCSHQEATIGNNHFPWPTRCVNTGLNEWGEFDVPDPSCHPYWGDFKKDRCTGIGFRQNSAIQWNDQEGWEGSCDDQGQAYFKLDDNYVFYARPNRCQKAGGHMWGEFDVPDVSCHAKGTTQDILISRANAVAELIREYVGVPADGTKFIKRSDIERVFGPQTIVLNIGGVGVIETRGFRYGMPQAINVTTKDVNPATHLPIPGLVKIKSFDNRYPFEDGFADYIIVQSGSLSYNNTLEIARMLNRCGRVALWIDEHSYAQQIMDLARLLNAPVQRQVSPDEAHAPKGAYQKLLIQKPC